MLCTTYMTKTGDSSGHKRTKVWTYALLNAPKSGHRGF